MSEQKNDPVLAAILGQYEKNKSGSGSQNQTDLTKYFATFLPKGTNSGEKIFRILPPPEGESPFVEVWLHRLQVGDNWPKLICPKKMDGGECPLCEVEEALKMTGKQEDKKLANQYRARMWYVVKGIDREKEDEGVKFWRFSHDYRGTGIFDKIEPIFGKKGNITDPREGRDLNIIMGRDQNNYTVVSSVIADDTSILTEDKTKANEWFNDKTTWRDVYRIKDVAYLQIIADGGVPMWDKDRERWINMEDKQGPSEAEKQLDAKLEETMNVDQVLDVKEDKNIEVPVVEESDDKPVGDDLPF